VETDLAVREHDPVYNSKIYAWMEKRFWVSRSSLMIFVLLGFFLGLATCGTVMQ